MQQVKFKKTTKNQCEHMFKINNLLLFSAFRFLILQQFIKKLNIFPANWNICGDGHLGL